MTNYLHSEISVGDTLQLSAPAGDFVLNEEGDLPIVLLSGGVGLTPMISMLNHLAAARPERLDPAHVHYEFFGPAGSLEA